MAMVSIARALLLLCIKLHTRRLRLPSPLYARSFLFQKLLRPNSMSFSAPAFQKPVSIDLMSFARVENENHKRLAAHIDMVQTAFLN